MVVKKKALSAATNTPEKYLTSKNSNAVDPSEITTITRRAYVSFIPVMVQTPAITVFKIGNSTNLYLWGLSRLFACLDISSYLGIKGLKPSLIKFLETAAVSACLHECQSPIGLSILYSRRINQTQRI